MRKNKNKVSKSNLIQIQDKGKEDPVPLQEPRDKQKFKITELTKTTKTDKNYERFKVTLFLEVEPSWKHCFTGQFHRKNHH